MKGVYQHCAEKHLHRYLAEFDFRYSNRVRLGVDDESRAGESAAKVSSASALPIGSHLISPKRSLKSKA